MSEETHAPQRNAPPQQPDGFSSERPTSRRLTRRGFLGLAAGAAAAAALAACQQAPAPSPTSAPAKAAAPAASGAAAPTAGAAAKAVPKEPIKIGVLAARAGVTAAVGQAGQRATEWWVDRTNKAGGILGRQVQLVIEEESNPKDTVERYRKLVLQDKVDIVVGLISTGVSLAVGQAAEEVGVPILMWDGTTQDGTKETVPNPKWIFRSSDNEVEAIGAAILTPKYFKDVKTIAGINNDYSYGHDNWDTFKAILDRYHELGLLPNKPSYIQALFPKLGETEFASHISALQQAKPDLIMCSFWSGDAPIFLKQAAAVGLFKDTKGVFTTAGGVADALKKDFVPEGLLVGYNSFYFEDPQLPQIGKEFVKDYKAKSNEYPSYETDHAVFVLAAYKAAVEKAYKAANEWPNKEQLVKALEGTEAESLSGMRSYRKDHIMMANWIQGITSHKNSYDFVTIDPIERLPLSKIEKPTGANLYDWIKGWKVGPDGQPQAS
ncbi:MAG: ABC transporter substrate-binding protein [Chloroflexota bacterium]